MNWSVQLFKTQLNNLRRNDKKKKRNCCTMYTHIQIAAAAVADGDKKAKRNTKLNFFSCI